MNRRCQEPTCTSLVEAVLTMADDFKTIRQLAEETRCTPNQVSAAVHHLLKHRATDFISDAMGTWWYLTPETDTRSRTVKLRAPEEHPRKTRKGVKKGGSK